jgi:type II secretory pathway pseudopilin PulG
MMIRKKHKEEAFSLIEVMFALGLFGIVSLSMASSFIQHMRANTDNEVRSGAIQAAQLVLDGLRTEDPASMPGDADSPATESRTETVAGRSFTVNITYCQDATLCASANMRHISVSVEYQGRTRFETQTVYTQLK